MSTTIAPEVTPTRRDTSDDDLSHIVCECDDMPICGAPSDGGPICEWDCTCPLHGPDCVVCVDLEDYECERCGA